MSSNSGMKTSAKTFFAHSNGVLHDAHSPVQSATALFAPGTSAVLASNSHMSGAKTYFALCTGAVLDDFASLIAGFALVQGAKLVFAPGTRVVLASRTPLQSAKMSVAPGTRDLLDDFPPLLTGFTPGTCAKVPVALCTGVLSARHFALTPGCAQVPTCSSPRPCANTAFALYAGGNSASFYEGSRATGHLRGNRTSSGEEFPSGKR
jgi:hypothetical protein